MPTRQIIGLILALNLAGRGERGPTGPWLLPMYAKAVKAAAMADGFVDAPDADNRCPFEGHLVALVVDAP